MDDLIPIILERFALQFKDTQSLFLGLLAIFGAIYISLGLLVIRGFIKLYVNRKTNEAIDWIFMILVQIILPLALLLLMTPYTFAALAAAIPGILI